MEPGSDPRVEGLDTQEQARREFDTHVVPRRAKAGVAGDQAGPWALALSGGGIRSATFCLGLVRGLAKNHLLKEFDYLSTVSGGGYLGASLGRLFGDQASAAQVEQGVKKDDSMWLWWLRNNGRYLIPAGAKDLGYAAASIIRGVISTHLEMAILILVLACLVLLPHMLVSVFPPFADGTLWRYGVLSMMPSVWNWLVLLPAFAFVHQLCAYWYTRERQTIASVGLITAATVFSGVLAWKLLDEAMQSPSPAMAVGKGILSVLALAPITAWLASLADGLRGTGASALRLMRTKRLAYCLWVIGVCLALAALDWGTWQLTRLFWRQDLSGLEYKITAAAVLLVTVGRLLLPEIQRWMAASKRPSHHLEKALNVLGVVLAVLVAVLWTTLLSIAIYPLSERLTAWRVSWSGLTSVWPIAVLGLALLGCAAYLLATRRSFDLLNLASLHNFYRARIERAYVSSGNSTTPEARFPSSALRSVSPELTMRVAPLTEAIPGDDVEMEDYRPHQWGGPIHLINCCINQSVDDRTGLYNADRKGVALAVSALGVETGTRFPDGDGYAASPGKLSRWVAISGAAASTGMGSRTSPGFAALLFMSGMRLGYWTPSLIRHAARATTTLRERLLRWAPKPVAIVAESIARFPGLFSPIWYASDGGHFDNTGIYALLKRRPRLIVAADCGADPKYLFGDLESLVRKAKIDYGAFIEFVDGAVLPDELKDIVGTPETIGPEAGARWLVLGRIAYSDGSEGVLLVVKPRRLDRMPFDMVAYADRNPDFPQQTTGDQFFDEAQWECYHQLGVMLGRSITPDLIARARQAVGEAVRPSSSLQEVEAQNVRAGTAATRRDRVGFTVRASLGAGLSFSVLLASWQGMEQFRESRRTEQREYEALALELSQKVQEQKIGSLFKEQFARLAEESEARGDGRFELVRERLNARCEQLSEPSREKTDCVRLHMELTMQPAPFYDYWFADKREAYQRARAPSAVAERPLAPRPVVDRTVAGGRLPASVPELPAAVDMPATAPMPPPVPSPLPDPGVATRTAPYVRDVRLVLHVYDEESRGPAQALGERLRQVLGAPSAPVENVVATARRAGRRAPYVWTKPAIVTHLRTDAACLALARGVFAEGVSEQRISMGRPNTLEIWLPPRTVDPVPMR